jgi:hypothetical protein
MKLILIPKHRRHEREHSTWNHAVFHFDQTGIKLRLLSVDSTRAASPKIIRDMLVFLNDQLKLNGKLELEHGERYALYQ